MNTFWPGFLSTSSLKLFAAWSPVPFLAKSIFRTHLHDLSAALCAAHPIKVLKVLFIICDLLVSTFQPQASFPPSKCILSRSRLHCFLRSSLILPGLLAASSPGSLLPVLFLITASSQSSQKLLLSDRECIDKEHNCIYPKEGMEKLGLSFSCLPVHPTAFLRSSMFLAFTLRVIL